VRAPIGMTQLSDAMYFMMNRRLRTKPKVKGARLLAYGSPVQWGSRAQLFGGDGQPLIRALLVGSRANFYSAIELRWRKLAGVGLGARGRERETSRKGAHCYAHDRLV